jgi:hypothetical protein
MEATLEDEVAPMVGVVMVAVAATAMEAVATTLVAVASPTKAAVVATQAMCAMANLPDLQQGWAHCPAVLQPLRPCVRR